MGKGGKGRKWGYVSYTPDGRYIYTSYENDGRVNRYTDNGECYLTTACMRHYLKKI